MWFGVYCQLINTDMNMSLSSAVGYQCRGGLMWFLEEIVKVNA